MKELRGEGKKASSRGGAMGKKGGKLGRTFPLGKR